jgi:preprotein translocase subunit SecG
MAIEILIIIIIAIILLVVLLILMHTGLIQPVFGLGKLANKSSISTNQTVLP